MPASRSPRRARDKGVGGGSGSSGRSPATRLLQPVSYSHPRSPSPATRGACARASLPASPAQRLTSPPPLTKAAARVVVKAVRNSIYPPKDNPFVSQDSKSISSTTEDKFGFQINDTYFYPPKNNNPSSCVNNPNKMSPQKNNGDSTNVDLPPPPLSRDKTAEEAPFVKNVSEEEPGHIFLKFVREETLRLNELTELVDKELSAENSHQIPEEMQEKLRMASGQARLLVKKKMQQFEGLCLKNINQELDDGYPTTEQDLAGFWDMMKLQIDQVHRQFSEIEGFRKSAWLVNGSDEVEGVASHDVNHHFITSSHQVITSAPTPTPVVDCPPPETKELQKREIQQQQQQPTQSPVAKARTGIGSRKNSWVEGVGRVSSPKSGCPQSPNTRSERLQIAKPKDTTSSDQRRPNDSAKVSEKDNLKCSSAVTENRRAFMKFK